MFVCIFVYLLGNNKQYSFSLSTLGHSWAINLDSDSVPMCTQSMSLYIAHQIAIFCCLSCCHRYSCFCWFRHLQLVGAKRKDAWTSFMPHLQFCCLLQNHQLLLCKSGSSSRIVSEELGFVHRNRVQFTPKKRKEGSLTLCIF